MLLSTLRPAARSLVGVVGALLLLGALAGCTSPGSKPVTDYTGEPKGVIAPPSSAGGAAYAVWMKNGAQYGIVLYGSSTCPPRVASVDVLASNQLKANLAPIDGGVCTQDLVPHTTVFATPSSVTTTSDVTIKLPDSTLTLPALRG